MKNLSMINWINVFSRVAKPAVFSLVLVLALTQVQANDIIKPSTVEFKYVGKTQGNPTFQINFENVEGETVYVALRDEQGNTIFADTFKDKSYSRNIRFDNVDLSDLKLTLTLRSKKSTHKQSFQINKSVRTVENIEIGKL